MEFNENLRILRKEKEFSQEYLAEKMNVSRQTISKWENGSAMPDMKKVVELVELFGTSMDELLGTTVAIQKQGQVSVGRIQAYAYSLTRVQVRVVEKKMRKRTTMMLVLIVALVGALIFTNISFSIKSNTLHKQINDLHYVIVNSYNIKHDGELTVYDSSNQKASNVDNDE